MQVIATIIACSRCERRVADMALRCRHCGAPFAGSGAVDKVQLDITAGCEDGAFTVTSDLFLVPRRADG